jgi:hypothetical protein
MSFIADNLTKILGGVTTLIGTASTLVTTGAFEGLLSPIGIRWLSIILALATALLGGATLGRGFNNSTQVKVATVIDNALKAQPPQETKQ